MIELPEEVRPSVRTYSVRSVDIEAGTLDVDFVTHGDHGSGSSWALHAQPGDVLGVRGPIGRPTPEAAWYLLVGDETALPAGRVLGVKKFTLAKLIESGIIPVVPINSESDKPGIRKADLDGFRQDYTYARDLADRRKTTVAEVASTLAAKAVAPVLKTRFDTHRLYRNSDLVEAGYH